MDSMPVAAGAGVMARRRAENLALSVTSRRNVHSTYAKFAALQCFIIRAPGGYYIIMALTLQLFEYLLLMMWSQCMVGFSCGFLCQVMLLINILNIRMLVAHELPMLTAVSHPYVNNKDFIE